MKKQIAIICLLLNSVFAWSQNFVKISAPCTDELVQKTPGRWINVEDNIYAPELNKAQLPEIAKRLDNIQQFVLKTYSTPIGVDAVWQRIVNDGLFCLQLKFSKTSEGELKYDIVNGIPVASYYYSCGFFRYSCSSEPNQMRTGYPGETGTSMFVYANNLQNFFIRMQLDNTLAQVMCIDGRPIKLMPFVKGKWKGNILYYPEPGSGESFVLLHREGMLPYIPVTRKEYLDRCIEYIPKFYDPMIKGYESSPDAKQREGYLKNASQQKEKLLKFYQDELKRATSANLLNSPAIIPTYIFNISDDPVFSSEEGGGRMLVTENPAYMRKDLPKYIPQFFIMTWKCSDWKPQKDVGKAIEEGFPIEKLQVMIDK